MTTNALPANGEPRLGWFVDGNPETDQLAVMLRNTEAAIELTVPLRGMFRSDDPYARWFSFGVDFGDDPERVKHTYKPPRTLLFDDSNGSVVLVGCRTVGAKMGFRNGQGRIVANFAVLGGRNLDYETVNGLKSSAPGIDAWVRKRLLEVDYEERASDGSQEVRLRFPKIDPIASLEGLNLNVTPTWRTEEPPGEFHAFEHFELKSWFDTPGTWEAHLRLHTAVLDLAAMSAWQPFGFGSLQVQRLDDPEKNLAGERMWDRWLDVVTHRLPVHHEWKKQPWFLFTFDDIGVDGMRRWLDLGKDYARALGPLLHILRSDEPWSVSNAIQSCIALEALGFLIDTHKHGGANRDKRDQVKFQTALSLVLDDMEVMPFSDLEEWKQRAGKVFRGLKHADNAEPDSLDVLNTQRQNLLVLRFWAAQRLGVSGEMLKDRLSTDPLANEYVYLD